jgi:hypothetical protein
LLQIVPFAPNIAGLQNASMIRKLDLHTVMQMRFNRVMARPHAVTQRYWRLSMSKGFAALLAASVLGLAGPLSPVIPSAGAQSVTIDRDGVRIDRRGRIDRQAAIRIARRNVIDRVRNADMRGRYWIVTGERAGGATS